MFYIREGTINCGKLACSNTDQKVVNRILSYVLFTSCLKAINGMLTAYQLPKGIKQKWLERRLVVLQLDKYNNDIVRTHWVFVCLAWQALMVFRGLYQYQPSQLQITIFVNLEWGSCTCVHVYVYPVRGTIADEFFLELFPAWILTCLYDSHSGRRHIHL